MRGVDDGGRDLGDLGLEPMATVLAGRAGEDLAADRGEQRLDRAVGGSRHKPRAPAVGRQRAGRAQHRVEREGTVVVIAGEVRQPRGEAPPPPARGLLRAEQPAAQLDRLGPGQRDGKGRVGGLEQVVALVEHDARHRAALGAAADGVDHHQSMIGDDEVGVGAGATGALDEAGAVVRAAGIDALAAAVAQAGDGGAAERRGEPAGQVAADEVAIAAVLGPAQRQLGEDRRATGVAALDRVLEVEQAQIVLAALADDDLGRLGHGIESAAGLVVELALERLGIGRQPNRSARGRRPVRRRGEVAESLADPGPRLEQRDVGCAGGLARAEGEGGGAGVRALPIATLGSGAEQCGEARIDLAVAHGDLARPRARWGVGPFRQHGEQAPLGTLRLLDPPRDLGGPAPAQTDERLGDAPRAVPLAPVVGPERCQ